MNDFPSSEATLCHAWLSDLGPCRPLFAGPQLLLVQSRASQGAVYPHPKGNVGSSPHWMDICKPQLNNIQKIGYPVTPFRLVIISPVFMAGFYGHGWPLPSATAAAVAVAHLGRLVESGGPGKASTLGGVAGRELGSLPMSR